MSEKRDHLAECNELGVPAQDFEMQFCARCLQSECVRSQHGKSRFEQRIGNWQDRLFTNVPRMNAEDPRVGLIQAKRFIDVNTGPVPEIGRRSASAWMDPRDLDVAPESPQATADPVIPPEEVKPASVPPEPPPQPSAPQHPLLMNTPAPQGRMLGGHKPPGPAADPWEVKPRETQGLQVVKPGARVKISGSGV